MPLLGSVAGFYTFGGVRECYDRSHTCLLGLN